MITVTTFYKFVDLPEYRELQVPLRSFCIAQGIKGSILLAEEGINATIAGPEGSINTVIAHLRSDARFANLIEKRSYCDNMPFKRMKVRLKREIVHLGIPGADPRNVVGTYVPPQEWNALISDPDVILIDTRNDYEVEIGTFEGAINPETDSFGEFPAYVATQLDPGTHRKVAMFCTGGIRCEKATSLLLQQGFEAVYHLEGGILKYLEEVAPEESMWQGECFVFDERVAVDHHLQPGQSWICPHCRTVRAAHEQCTCDRSQQASASAEDRSV